MKRHRVPLMTVVGLLALLFVPGCGLSGGGGATVEPATISQDQTLSRQDASTSRVRTRSIGIMTPGTLPGVLSGASSAAPSGSFRRAAPVPLPPGSPAHPGLTHPEPSEAETPRGGKGSATRWERLTTIGAWAPAILSAASGNTAGGGLIEPPEAPPVRDGMSRVWTGKEWIEAPAGSTIQIDEYESDTTTGGTATAQASVDAKSAGWTGVGSEVVGDIKAALAKFVLPGLPGAQGASSGGSGGGGSFGAGLSAMGGDRGGAGGLLLILGAIALAASVVVWWFTKPLGTKIAIALALLGGTLIALGIFIDWEWTPIVLLVALVGAAVAGVLWIRKRKLEDDEYDDMADALTSEAIDLQTTLEAVVTGVEESGKTMPESAAVIKKRISQAAAKTGDPATVKRVVSNIKSRAGLIEGQKPASGS